MGVPDHFAASWETCMSVKKQQLESYMEQLIGSKMEKEYIKTEHCHPAYLTYMQKNSMPNAGLSYQLELRLMVIDKISHINNLRYTDDTTLKAESKRNLKSL